MELIRIPYRIADITDGQLGQLEQLRCFCHSVAEQELLGGFPDSFFENTPEVGAVQPAELSNPFYRDIILEILFNIIQSFFNIEITDFPAGRQMHGHRGTGQVVDEKEEMPDQVEGRFVSVLRNVEHLVFHEFAQLF